MRLDGFGIMVDDMGEMIRFYRDVLGFEIKEKESESNVYLIKAESTSITSATISEECKVIAQSAFNFCKSLYCRIFIAYYNTLNVFGNLFG